MSSSRSRPSARMRRSRYTSVVAAATNGTVMSARAAADDVDDPTEREEAERQAEAGQRNGEQRPQSKFGPDDGAIPNSGEAPGAAHPRPGAEMLDDDRRRDHEEDGHDEQDRDKEEKECRHFHHVHDDPRDKEGRSAPNRRSDRVRGLDGRVGVPRAKHMSDRARHERQHESGGRNEREARDVQAAGRRARRVGKRRDRAGQPAIRE